MLEHSEQFTEIAAALAAAQASFPELTEDSEGRIEYDAKGDRAAGGFRYGYASLGNVLATFRPALAAQKIAILQPARHAPDDKGAIVIEVQTWLVHASGQWFRSPVSRVFAPGGDIKKTGGAITYLRRYQIGALLGVAPEEDTDDGAGQRKENVRQAPPPQRQPPRVAPPADRTLEPGRDPAAMTGGTEVAQPDPVPAIRAAIAKKEWQVALPALTAMPPGPAKDQLKTEYHAARYGGATNGKGA